MTARGEQTWFPSGDRTLEGWVHRPDDGRAVGAVVIAGPFAHEALVTYRALRVMAVEAARQGFVAVRFSWSGTGDSEPAPAATDLALAWQEDLAAAVELARSASGVDDVQAIGVRFGAAVVAEAPVSLRRRVLWAPLGGRAFLRMQSSLLTMHLPADFPRAQQGLELCGYMLDEADASSLRRLRDPRSAMAETGPHTSWILVEDEADASAELFDREPNYARVSMPSVRRVLSALEPSRAAPVPEWSADREHIVSDPSSGRGMRHSLVDIGPDRLPAILTEPIGGVPASSAALLVPFANDAKGADRIARATSLRLAERGVPTLRADRRGIGDAADPRDLAETTSLTEDQAGDVVLFAEWLAERTHLPVIGIGLCSGAWLVARAALRAPFQRLLLINNQAWSTSERYYERQRRMMRTTADTTADPDAETLSPSRGGLARRLKRFVRHRAPYQIRFRLFSGLGVDEIAESLLAPIPRQTSVRLLNGSADQRHWESTRGPHALRRLSRRGHRIRVDHDPRADHALMSEAALQSYLDLLDEEFDVRDEPVATIDSRA